MKAQFPCAVLRIDPNLEAAPLTQVLESAAHALESAREFIVDVLGGCQVAELTDEIYKPIIKELLRRRLEIETHPAARGNA